MLSEIHLLERARCCAEGPTEYCMEYVQNHLVICSAVSFPTGSERSSCSSRFLVLSADLSRPELDGFHGSVRTEDVKKEGNYVGLVALCVSTCPREP